MDSTTTERALAESWGSRVAAARQRAGLSQAGLGELCGVAQQTVSKIERGRMVPLDRLKLRLASELGTSPSVLFAWPAPPCHDGDATGGAPTQAGGVAS